MAKLVAVTGANGFIASHIVNELLERGYTVRACVRDPANKAKNGHLEALAQGKPGKLELHSGDLLRPGSYDDAVAGCDAVVHSAAVVEVLSSQDPQKEIVDPAIEGTSNILAAVDKAPSVKVVVCTSSCLSIQSFNKPEGHEFTEEDWNDWSTIENGDAYGYGKTAAEKLVHSRSAGKSWKYAIINPGVTLGPVFCKQHTKSSTSLVRELLYQNPLNSYLTTFVDVRDVAKAHAEALERPEANGHRFLCVGDSPCMNTLDLGPIADKALPEFATKATPKLSPLTFGVFSMLSKLPWLGPKIMTEFQRLAVTTPIKFSNAKAKEILGLSFRPLEDTVRDSALSMTEGGYVKPKPRA